MNTRTSTPINAGTDKSTPSGRLFFLDNAAGRVLSANPDGSDLKTLTNEGENFRTDWRSIINTAFEELQERGFRAVRIESISARTSIAKEFVYRRWPTRSTTSNNFALVNE